MGEKYFIGIDAGSTYIKVAVIKNHEVFATKLANTGINNSKTAEEMINQLLKENHIKKVKM